MHKWLLFHAEVAGSVIRVQRMPLRAPTSDHRKASGFFHLTQQNTPRALKSVLSYTLMQVKPAVPGTLVCCRKRKSFGQWGQSMEEATQSVKSQIPQNITKQSYKYSLVLYIVYVYGREKYEMAFVFPLLVTAVIRLADCGSYSYCLCFSLLAFPEHLQYILFRTVRVRAIILYL